MINKIGAAWWYCCPRCGKKLLALKSGGICRGVLVQCRGRLKDGSRCGWSGEVVVMPGDCRDDKKGV